jgi:hypothetical protein
MGLCVSREEFDQIRNEVERTKNLVNQSLPEAQKVRKEVQDLREEINRLLAKLKKEVDEKNEDLKATLERNAKAIEGLFADTGLVKDDMKILQKVIQDLRKDVTRIQEFIESGALDPVEETPDELGIKVVKEEIDDDINWSTLPLRMIQPIIPIDIFSDSITSEPTEVNPKPRSSSKTQQASGRRPAPTQLSAPQSYNPPPSDYSTEYKPSGGDARVQAPVPILSAPPKPDVKVAPVEMYEPKKEVVQVKVVEPKREEIEIKLQPKREEIEVRVQPKKEIIEVKEMEPEVVVEVTEEPSSVEERVEVKVEVEESDREPVTETKESEERGNDKVKEEKESFRAPGDKVKEEKESFRAPGENDMLDDTYVAIPKGAQKLFFTIPIGEDGVGLNLGSYGTPVQIGSKIVSRVLVKSFREIPGGRPNPAMLAGVKMGDVLEAVNGQTAASPQGLVKLLQNASGNITITVYRGV